jgi:hypothetical protein
VSGGSGGGGWGGIELSGDCMYVCMSSVNHAGCQQYWPCGIPDGRTDVVSHTFSDGIDLQNVSETQSRNGLVSTKPICQ